eukprot:12535351-Heterocapsa_arctica.AAC.1
MRRARSRMFTSSRTGRRPSPAQTATSSLHTNAFASSDAIGLAGPSEHIRVQGARTAGPCVRSNLMGSGACRIAVRR